MSFSADISGICDECQSHIRAEDDDIFCKSCYADSKSAIAKERDKLLEENDALKAELAAHGIDVQHVPRAPWLGPEVLVWSKRKK